MKSLSFKICLFIVALASPVWSETYAECGKPFDEKLLFSATLKLQDVNASTCFLHLIAFDLMIDIIME